MLFRSSRDKSLLSVWQLIPYLHPPPGSQVSCHCSVTKSCPTVCDPMDYSTPGFPVLHYLLEFAQTHIHRVGDAIQPSHPLSSPSLPAFNLSQHQCLGVSKINWIAESDLFLGPAQIEEMNEGPSEFCQVRGLQRPSLGGKGWLLAFFSP